MKAYVMHYQRRIQMSKSKDIIESMTDEELKILLLAFSKPKVIEAMRIYHTIPGFLKKSFIEPGKIEMEKRGIVSLSICLKLRGKKL